jgi:hypothetical protein
MDDFPPQANPDSSPVINVDSVGSSRTLPAHDKRSKDNMKTKDPCAGREVTDIMSDVGLFYGSCPVCSESFVYLPGKNSWIEEEQFENTLAKANG